MKTADTSIRWWDLVAGLVFSGGLLFAQDPGIAPFHEEFVKYHQMGLKAAGTGFGLIPAPVDLSYLTHQEIAHAQMQRVTLPARYDLRTLGRVTPVRNQGAYGTCWAFATFGSIESFLAPAESLDFSENNLIHRDGFDYGFNSGGHYIMSMAYLADWRGPVDELEDPYPSPSSSPSSSPPDLPILKHVQQMRLIPGKSGPADNDTIKRALMENGAVYASYYHNNAFWNPVWNTYHFPGSGWANHAVTIVGWDDDFDRNKFLFPPVGNGAYLVKNSWGEDWGEDGYFYVSYHDTRFGYDAMCAFHSADTPDNYAAIYSHDPLGWVANLGIGTTTFWAANLFEARASGELGAVGFYANSVNTSYVIQVYSGVSAGAPGSGTLVATRTGTAEDPGYSTISLDPPVALVQGRQFSIVLKLTTPGYNYPLAMEYAVPGYSSAATAAPGQSFYSVDGATWYDLSGWNRTANFCIKGYSVMPGSAEISVTEAGGSDLSDGNATISYEATVIGSSSVRVFTINNTGPRYLKGIRVMLESDAWGDYVLNTEGSRSLLAPGGSTCFSVIFKPNGVVSGNRSAELRIASNDEDEDPFDIMLTSLALSPTADVDGDGLGDLAEYRYAAMGFDWQVEQSALVGVLYESANLAGLYTDSQVRTLQIDTPLLTRDPGMGSFKLTIGVRKSSDLLSWDSLPFNSAGTTINSEGEIEFRFTSPDKTAFFRLESR
jgi:C1A family cysteine protease